MNYSSLWDRIGFVHTWIKYDGEDGRTKYFSFSAGTTLDTAGNILFDIDNVGLITNDKMQDRVPTTQISIEITEQQYNNLIINIASFEGNKVNYDILPDEEGDFNCTTAAGYVLSQSGIHYLDGLQNPYAVSNRIDNTDRLPNSNIMDFSKTPKSDPLSPLETTLAIKDDIHNYDLDRIINLAEQLFSYITMFKSELDKSDHI